MAGPLTARRGLTLVETLIALVLGGMLLTLLYSVLSQVLVIYGRSQARADLQNESLVALTRLVAELRVTTLASITVAPSPAAIAYGVADTRGTFTGSAELFPLFGVCWLDDATHELKYKRWPAAGDPVVLTPSPFDTGRRLKAAELTRIESRPNGTERVLARDVRSFSITPPLFPALQPVDSFSFELNVARPWRQETLQQTATLTVTPRNEAAVLAPP